MVGPRSLRHLGVQLLQDLEEVRETARRSVPDDRVVDDGVAVDQEVAERDDPREVWKPLRRIGVGARELAQRFAEDLELTLTADRSCTSAW